MIVEKSMLLHTIRNTSAVYEATHSNTLPDVLLQAVSLSRNQREIFQRADFSGEIGRVPI